MMVVSEALAFRTFPATALAQKWSSYFLVSRQTNKQLSLSGQTCLNGKKHSQNSHSIIHCPTSEGVSEVSGASERVSAAEGASEANE